jgi:hypothetical protein
LCPLVTDSVGWFWHNSDTVNLDEGAAGEP